MNDREKQVDRWPGKKEHDIDCLGRHCECGIGEWNACCDAHEACRKAVDDKLTSAMQVIKYQCEDKDKIRELAQKHLTKSECFGDSYGVPPLVEVIELLIRRIEAPPSGGLNDR